MEYKAYLWKRESDGTELLTLDIENPSYGVKNPVYNESVGCYDVSLVDDPLSNVEMIYGGAGRVDYNKAPAKYVRVSKQKNMDYVVTETNLTCGDLELTEETYTMFYDNEEKDEHLTLDLVFIPDIDGWTDAQAQVFVGIFCIDGAITAMDIG